MGNGVLLDTNCFSHVFNCNDKRFGEFKAVLQWLCYGPGYLVYGGSKYLDELKKAERYLKVFSLLHVYNKVHVYDSASIDSEQERITRLVDDERFDDPHLPAIVIVSKCQVICTGDDRCIPFLKRKDIYDGRVACPKFYTGENCSHLLKPKYVGTNLRLNKNKANELIKGIDVVIK